MTVCDFQYRNLLECESLEFSVSMHYPIYWNEKSDWTFSLTFCKTTAYFVYAHKYFLTGEKISPP